MTPIESEMLKFVAGLGLLVIGAVLKAAFDRIAAERGWTREDKRAQDGKIERVDSHARSEATRIERELGGKLADLSGRLGAVEGEVGILAERVANLPTADDMQALNLRLAAVDKGLSAVQSRVEGMGANVKTILDHILAAERRG